MAGSIVTLSPITDAFTLYDLRAVSHSTVWPPDKSNTLRTLTADSRGIHAHSSTATGFPDRCRLTALRVTPGPPGKRSWHDHRASTYPGDPVPSDSGLHFLPHWYFTFLTAVE